MKKFINRVSSLVLVLSIFLVYEKQASAVELHNQDEFNQVMVTYKSNEQEVKTVEVPTGHSTSEFLDKLEKQPNVANVEPDYTMDRTVTANDPEYSKQWYHQVIGTEEAWKVTTGSNDIVVAVIDDGIDLHHKDLKNQIILPYDIVLNRKSFIPIGAGHGTHVSGIIAGTLNNGVGGTGIAPNVKIMPINVFDGESALYSDVIKGIQYAIDHDADIINLSIGGTEPSEILNDAIQRAFKAGILVVAAAGNEGKNIYDYPAAYDHVLAVSATDSSDKIADFSNYGTDIDLAAPGTRIFSTLPDNEYGFLSGTSMATPVVTGVAALVWAANPSLTNVQIEEQLYKTAVDLGPKGKDIYYGYGRINASEAVKVMKIIQEETPTLTVNEIADYQTIITGKFSSSIQNGTISIYTKDTTLATTELINQDTFSISIPKQKAGTKVYIKVDHPTILPIEMTVIDQTPPIKPTVNSVTDHTAQIKGIAEAGTTVKVQKGSDLLGTAIVNGLGEFTVFLNKEQMSGTKLKITATDSAGNISVPVVKTVLDKTSPAAPVVNKVTKKTTNITGKAEPYTIAYLQKNGKIIGTTKVTSKGTYSIKISKKNATKTLYIYVKDKAKNISKKVAVTF